MIPEKAIIIQEKSQEAINNGYKFPGYLACDAESFEKPELIGLLNILWMELNQCKNLNIKYEREAV